VRIQLDLAADAESLPHQPHHAIACPPLHWDVQPALGLDQDVVCARLQGHHDVLSGEALRTVLGDL
jgi:hypothetical protein